MKTRIALGIDIGGTNTKVGLVTHEGESIARETVKTPKSRTLEDVMRVVTEVKEDLLSRHNVTPEGIGIGAPGVVDIDREIVVEAPNFPTWTGLPLRRIISERFNLPAEMENDVNAFGLGEHLWGAAQGLHNFVAVAVGTGVGGAIFIDGSLYRGSHGAAGEMGFTILSPDGPQAGGTVGVLEAYIGRRSFDEEVCKLFPTGEFPTPRKITQLAAEGEERARFIQSKIAGYLAEAAATWVHLLNPEAIVIGGGTTAGADYLLAEFERKLRDRARASHTRHLQVLPGKLGYFAGVLGAAAAWFSPHE